MLNETAKTASSGGRSDNILVFQQPQPKVDGNKCKK